MTCIVGIAREGKVYMGGDSIGISEHSKCQRNDPKVFKLGQFLIGFTTSYRMGQLLKYSLRIPQQTDNQSDFEYMVTTFIPKVRECLETGGFEDDGGIRGGVFLVGYKGKLYKVWSDFQVSEPTTQYGSCGSGEDLALGSLFATRHHWDCHFRILDALKAAETFNVTVGGPFAVEVL